MKTTFAELNKVISDADNPGYKGPQPRILSPEAVRELERLKKEGGKTGDCVVTSKH